MAELQASYSKQVNEQLLMQHMLLKVNPQQQQFQQTAAPSNQHVTA